VARDQGVVGNGGKGFLGAMPSEGKRPRELDCLGPRKGCKVYGAPEGETGSEPIGSALGMAEFTGGGKGGHFCIQKRVTRGDFGRGLKVEREGSGCAKKGEGSGGKPRDSKKQS